MGISCVFVGGINADLATARFWKHFKGLQWRKTTYEGLDRHKKAINPAKPHQPSLQALQVTVGSQPKRVHNSVLCLPSGIQQDSGAENQEESYSYGDDYDVET